MRAALLLVPVLALACVPDGPRSDEVRVEVRHVGRDGQDLPVVLLAERGGPRWLPIWIGSAEARSIALGLDGGPSPRPNTHDLAQRVIHGLRGEVERVVVTELRDGTYYALVTLRTDGERVEIDARPSDAIALALRSGAPIFVRERLLSEGGGPAGAEERPAHAI